MAGERATIGVDDRLEPPTTSCQEFQNRRSRVRFMPEGANKTWEFCEFDLVAKAPFQECVNMCLEKSSVHLR